MPLHVVYKGLHLYNTWCNGGPDGTRYNCSPSGWMESEQFVEWFTKVFIESTKELDGNKLLIFDGHNSHISSAVVNLAILNNIT
jgi:DDE superfamily endonuclease